MDRLFKGIEDEMISNITNGEDAPSEAGTGAVAAMASRTQMLWGIMVYYAVDDQ
jgi:hypothetical protein